MFDSLKPAGLRWDPALNIYVNDQTPVINDPKPPKDKDNPLEKQVDGDHYTKLKIQPMEYSMANRLDACQHTAIKYITRFRDKGTPKEDLLKAIHVIEMLMKIEGLND